MTVMGVEQYGFWQRWRLWVLTTMEIGVSFDEIGVGVTMVGIDKVEIDGWRDWHGRDWWVVRSVDWVLTLLWILSFDFAIDFGWIARLGFDFAQREWHWWWFGILLGLWWVWGHGGGCLEVVWLKGWLLCDESDRETEIRKERDIICLLFDCIIYIILICWIAK